MTIRHRTFKERYGPLAMVAGASKGLGAVFAEALAREGFNLVLIARDQEQLLSFSENLIRQYAVDVLPVTCDLKNQDAIEQIKQAIADQTVNLIVYNAAGSYIGPFLDQPISEHLDIANVNMITLIKMLHHFGERMKTEKRGGLVLMSSLAGNQGSGFLATYAATKSFNRVLAESLWYEWKTKGIDVIACVAGSILTPNFVQTKPGKISSFAPAPQIPEEVVKECFSKIGKVPSFISGRSNKLACFLMNRIFSIKKAVMLMGDSTRKMYRIND